MPTHSIGTSVNDAAVRLDQAEVEPDVWIDPVHFGQDHIGLQPLELSTIARTEWWAQTGVTPSAAMATMAAPAAVHFMGMGQASTKSPGTRRAEMPRPLYAAHYLRCGCREVGIRSVTKGRTRPRYLQER